MYFRKHSKKQSGVILVFSLLMLLLISLLGVNMVEQNRVQFLMAGNSQQQSIDFSTAENVLRLVEDYIDTTRYEVWPFVPPPPPPPNYPDVAYTCKTNTETPPRLDQIKPNDPFDDTDNINDLIDLSDEALALGVIAKITKTSCLKTGGVEQECKADKNESSGWDVDESNCNQITVTQCPTEIYTINIKVTNKTGSKKVIESRYAVRCDYPS